jgi:hypothetical protein
MSVVIYTVVTSLSTEVTNVTCHCSRKLAKDALIKQVLEMEEENDEPKRYKKIEKKLVKERPEHYSDGPWQYQVIKSKLES